MSTHCTECGHTFHSSDASEAQARIVELETQVRLLNSKASSYADKLADYEDEIRAMSAQLQKERKDQISTPGSVTDSRLKEYAPLPTPPPAVPAKDAGDDARVNRQSLSRLTSLASYWPGRRKENATDSLTTPPVPSLNLGLNLSTPNLSTPPMHYFHSPPPFSTDPGRQGQSLTLVGLQSSLENERQLRQQAESSLAQSQTELEELTAQLFGQANEMVATERKARAKLEERVKLLETRDGEKRRRLERLEKAVERIERVRRMVVDHEKEMGEEAYMQTEVVQGRKVMRHMRPSRSRSRSRPRRGNGYTRINGKGRPEIVSEDEEEVDDICRRMSTLADYDDPEKSTTYEFDVQLKVWRRSQANMWKSPSFD